VTLGPVADRPGPLTERLTAPPSPRVSAARGAYEVLIVRRIFGSLIVVTALVSMGVMATGAYFQTAPQTLPTPVTLTTGTTSLGVSFYPGQAPVVPLLIAPGWSTTFCVDIVNNGDYGLSSVSKTVQSTGDPGLWGVLRLAVINNGTCTPGPGTSVGDNTLQGWDGYTANLGPLAKSAHIYLLETLSFPTDGDQSGLQGKTIAVNETFTGQTP
jgi:hypothetical protein